MYEPEHVIADAAKGGSVANPNRDRPCLNIRPPRLTMTIDLTRRSLLRLAGASSLAVAAAAAARAEGNAGGGGPTFASRTPMRVGTGTLRGRNLNPVADFYRDVIGLTG